MDLLKTIEQRTSIRTFAKDPLTSEDLAVIDETLEEARKRHRPFSTSLAFFRADAASMKVFPAYGLVKNPRVFIGATTEASFLAHVDLGYVLQHALLSLCAYGLGTVWLGAFRLDKRAAGLDEAAHLPALIALGRKATPSLREKTVKRLSKGARRKPPEALFYPLGSHRGLSEETYRTSCLHTPLEALRRAPSSMNSQPWRVVFTDGAADVHIAKKYGASPSMKAIDAGIGLCHLVLGLQALWDDVRIERREPMDARDFTYVASVRWS